VRAPESIKHSFFSPSMIISLEVSNMILVELTLDKIYFANDFLGLRRFLFVLFTFSVFTLFVELWEILFTTFPHKVGFLRSGLFSLNCLTSSDDPLRDVLFYYTFYISCS
jgi:hypothetical protein